MGDIFDTPVANGMMAALPKCWLGFKIAYGRTQRMNVSLRLIYYKSLGRYVYKVTFFDSNVHNEPATLVIASSCFDKKIAEKQDTIEESNLIYCK